MTLRQFLLPLCVLLLTTSCQNNTKQPSPEPLPPTPQTVEMTNATLVYLGDQDKIEISTHHKLTLYTDMVVNDQGYPIGPGTIIQLSLNTTPKAAESTDISLPEGTYGAAISDQDFSPFTFILGYKVQIDLPEGKVEMPDGSFYGEIASGQTNFPADLLMDGAAKVVKNSDGTYTVTGQVIGDKFTKRNFTYTGKLTPIDRSEPEVGTANTTLKSDLALSDLTKARIEDRGDYYALGDESYRALNLYLAASTIDLTQMWASGSGNFLQVEIFVPFATKAADGIPQGTYSITTRSENGGLMRENIRPFNIAPGYPDKFTNPDGTWFFGYENSVAKQFARIDGGEMIVTREGGAHHIVINFTDCATPANKVTFTFDQTTPIEVFQFNPAQSIVPNYPSKNHRQ